MCDEREAGFQGWWAEPAGAGLGPESSDLDLPAGRQERW